MARAVDNPPASGREPGLTGRTRTIGTSQSWWLYTLAGIVLAAAALRFSGLGLQSFDEDEAATVSLMHLPFSQMLNHIGPSESTPPLYYLLAWPWTHVFGTGESAIRSLSALIGLLTVPAAFMLGNVIAGRRSGLVAAALAATSPMLVWYSQEARAYALVALFATVASVYFVRALGDPSRANLTGWAIAGALGLLSHYFAGFLIFGEALWLFATSRRRQQVFVASLLPLGTALALIPLVQAQRANPLKTSYIQLSSLGSRITGIVKEFLLGPSIALGRVAGVVLALGFAVAAVLLARRAAQSARMRAAALAAVAAAALAVPIGIAVISSKADFVIARNMLPVLVPLLAVAAAGFATSARGVAAAAVVALVSLAASVAVPLSTKWQRPDWREVARTIGRIAPAPRAILSAPYYRGAAPLFVYLNDAMTTKNLNLCVREIDLVGLVAEGSTRPLTFPVDRPPAPGYTLIERRATASVTILRFQGPPVSRRQIHHAIAARTVLQHATAATASGTCP